MELEEMQTAWSELSRQLENQKRLTHKIIMEMTQQKYSDKFRKFMRYEGLGAVICYAYALYILFNFGKLDTWYFEILGIAAMLFLLGLPIWILTAVKRIQTINILEGNYKETLLRYARARKQLLFAQRAAIYLCFVFIFISIPLSGKLLKNKDYFMNGLGWLWFIPVLGAFVFFFTRWSYRHYLDATNRAEDLIRELE